MSRLIERMETPTNLAAIHEFCPDAGSVVDGLKHLLNIAGHEATTVYRLVRSYGSKLREDQIAMLKQRADKPEGPKRKRTFYADVSEEYLNRSHGPLLYNSYQR